MGIVAKIITTIVSILFLGVYPLLYNIIDTSNQRKPLLKRINLAGWVFLSFVFLIIVTNIFIVIDENNNSQFVQNQLSGITAALTNKGYKYDSLKKQIIRISAIANTGGNGIVLNGSTISDVYISGTTVSNGAIEPLYNPISKGSIISEDELIKVVNEKLNNVTDKSVYICTVSKTNGADAVNDITSILKKNGYISRNIGIYFTNDTVIKNGISLNIEKIDYT